MRATASATLAARLYVMNIALDFRLIDTRTLEVVDVISYQKQIIGRELRAGVFSFFDDTIVDIAAGERALEPVQLAVRAGVERAVVEVMSRFYNVNDSGVCASRHPSRRRSDGPRPIANRPPTLARRPPRSNNRAPTRTAWNDRRDDNLTALRGRS
jgi:hypothetical protein